jgi:hypothetical protein
VNPSEGDGACRCRVVGEEDAIRRGAPGGLRDAGRDCRQNERSVHIR